MEPSEDVVSQIKAQAAMLNPPREVRQFTMGKGDNPFIVLMTPPNREEWKKYTLEMSAANDENTALVAAIERAALAQIRWPEREKVRAFLEFKPGIVQKFAPVLAELAGAHDEIVEKKL